MPTIKAKPENNPLDSFILPEVFELKSSNEKKKKKKHKKNKAKSKKHDKKKNNKKHSHKNKKNKKGNKKKNKKSKNFKEMTFSGSKHVLGGTVDVKAKMKFTDESIKYIIDAVSGIIKYFMSNKNK